MRTNTGYTSIMAILSSKLSPQARLKITTATAGETTTVVLEIGRAAVKQKIEDILTVSGGKIDSWIPATRVMRLTIPVDQVAKIARLRGVNYLELSERFSNPEAPAAQSGLLTRSSKLEPGQND